MAGFVCKSQVRQGGLNIKLPRQTPTAAGSAVELSDVSAKKGFLHNILNIHGSGLFYTDRRPCFVIDKSSQFPHMIPVSFPLCNPEWTWNASMRVLFVSTSSDSLRPLLNADSMVQPTGHPQKRKNKSCKSMTPHELQPELLASS